MCTWVTTETEVLTSVQALINHGWEVREEDVEYENGTLGDYLDTCLCPIDVEAVLERAGVTYYYDPFGFTLIEPTDPSDIEFHEVNAERRRDTKPEGILLVFRDCRECGQSIACLLEGNAPTSCKEHQ